MTVRVASNTREEARHWLPSQGVDPAPLAELNAECLGLLVMRAADAECAVSLPPLVAALREQWAALSAHAVRRLAGAPFTLFDAGLASAPRWLEVRSRGVHEHAQRAEPGYFEPAAARSITRRQARSIRARRAAHAHGRRGNAPPASAARRPGRHRTG